MVDVQERCFVFGRDDSTLERVEVSGDDVKHEGKYKVVQSVKQFKDNGTTFDVPTLEACVIKQRG